jgi:hypothetical protein
MTVLGHLQASVARPIFDCSAPKAATPVLPIERGIKLALLFGEPVDQHVEEQLDFGA